MRGDGGEGPAAAVDPVHEEDGRWYFYEETWADRQGPFDSREEAAEACERYAREVLG